MSAIEKRGVGKRAIAETHNYTGDSRYRPSNGRKAMPLSQRITELQPSVTAPTTRPKVLPSRLAPKKPIGPVVKMRPDVARQQLSVPKLRPMSPTQQQALQTVVEPTSIAEERLEPPTKVSRLPRPKRRILQAVISAALIAVIAVSGYLAYSTWHTNHHVAEAAKRGGNGVDDIDETPVTSTQVDSYVVASDMPRYLTIPTMNIKARVQTTIVDTSTNQMGAPTNLDDVAWYRGGATPGDPGLTFIDGYSQGSTRPGVFKRLGNLKQQQVIGIEMGDGRQYDYQVASVATMPVQSIDMAGLLTPPDDTGSYLVLMSCNASYDHQTTEYQQRVVVKATLVKA